ncbi:hypothetical protein FB451DRAFT_511977 [Mycena latifolia]|nr:hypothetical protein FB451DRAFT_511977 [Mycena latifolia]
MSSVSESPLPFVASVLPNTFATNILLASSILALITACTIFFISPARLTRGLAALMDETEKAYFTAIEAGVLCKCDVQAKEMSRLQIMASQLREAILRDSLSGQKTVWSFMRGRSLTVLRCIWDTRRFKICIEILAEERLRDLNFPESGARISLRRRRAHLS